MPWGKRNYNQTIETQTSRIRIVDLIAANVDTESEKLLYLKLQVFLWSLFSSIPSPVYLQSWELYCWQCASINTERKETNPLRGMQVQTALKIPLFLHFKRCNIYPTYRYICVHLSRVVSFDVLGLQNTSFVFYIIVAELITVKLHVGTPRVRKSGYLAIREFSSAKFFHLIKWAFQNLKYSPTSNNSHLSTTVTSLVRPLFFGGQSIH